MKRRGSPQRVVAVASKAVQPEERASPRTSGRLAVQAGSGAREAALRYAEDSEFASEFESVLQEIYLEHLDTLRRIRTRLGAPADEPSETGLRPASGREGNALVAGAVTPERVQELLGASAGVGLTRGDIAARLGIDSRDARLTRALRALKVSRMVKQNGIRRSARYHVIRSDTGG
jgi:hypothetical protein